MSSTSRVYPLGLVAGGAVGALAASALIVERFHLLENPDIILSCDINPVISCGSVMTTDQAQAFGFPNPLIGIVGFTVVATLGVVLATGADLPRWFLRAFGAGTLFGVGFVHWLIFQSLYRIGALCPYCMVVWAVMIPIFVTTAAHLARAGVVRLPGRIRGVLVEYQGAIVTAWYLVIAALATRRFWSYWRTLLP